MPGWHDATRELQREDAIEMLGIVQEQHPARARLFMQWKQMDWPILVDPLNLLEVPYVPITLLIDEHGIVRRQVSFSDDPAEAASSFAKKMFDPPGAAESSEEEPARQEASGPAEAVVRRRPEALDTAIESYRQAARARPDDPWAHFRLGVALRARYDSEARRAGDFQDAVDQWSRALELDPNNYIFRRRIQQYGPLLDKPYPFYAWVERARAAIRARGETPVPLEAEPSGSELAGRHKRLATADDGRPAPDPEARIIRDPGKMVALRSVVVPPRVAAGDAARIHLQLRPREGAHWNNTAGPTAVWLDPAEACVVDRRHHALPLAGAEVSEEVRRLEVEIRCGEPPDEAAEPLRGYALYYVCQSDDGPCLYRRQDFAIDLDVVEQDASTQTS